MAKTTIEIYCDKNDRWRMKIIRGRHINVKKYVVPEWWVNAGDAVNFALNTSSCNTITVRR